MLDTNSMDWWDEEEFLRIFNERYKNRHPRPENNREEAVSNAFDADFFIWNLKNEKSRSAMRNEDLLTNDMITLEGNLAFEPELEVEVNGKPLRIRSRMQLLVLIVLAEHRRRSSQGTSRDTFRTRFMKTKQIRKFVESLLNELALQASENKEMYVLEEDIRLAVFHLRNILKQSHFNKDLIESSKSRGKGYRLSTPRDRLGFNIQMSDQTRKLLDSLPF